jgi:hypothetical protein
MTHRLVVIHTRARFEWNTFHGEKVLDRKRKNLYRWCLTLTCDLHLRRRNTGIVHDTPSSGHTSSYKIWMEYLSRLKSSRLETKNTLYRWHLTVTCDLHMWRINTGFVHDTPSSAHKYLCKIWMEYLTRLKSSRPETKSWYILLSIPLAIHIRHGWFCCAQTQWVGGSYLNLLSIIVISIRQLLVQVL